MFEPREKLSTKEQSAGSKPELVEKGWVEKVGGGSQVDDRLLQASLQLLKSSREVGLAQTRHTACIQRGGCQILADTLV